MSKLTKLLVALLTVTTANAGLPPTNLKGSADTTAKTTFQFVVPNNQATQIAGVQSRIETGSTNLLKNPNMEGGTTSWTASAGSLASTTSSPLEGATSITWDASASTQTLTSDAITIPVGRFSQKMSVSCNILAASGTATHTIMAWDGSNELGAVTITSSTVSSVVSSTSFYAPTSGTIALRIKANADEPSIKIDECKIQAASDIYLSSVSPWTTYTPTFTGFGTVSVQNFRWRQVGESVQIEGKFTVGTPTATEARVSLPNAYVSASDYTTVNSAGIAANGTAGSGEYMTLIEPSVSYITFGIQNASFGGHTKRNGDSFSTTGDVLSLHATVRVTALTSQAPAVVVNPNIGPWTTYTPTFTGFGTVSAQNFRYRQVGESIQVEGRFTAGTTTATEARITLPNSYVSDSSYVTLEGAGNFLTNGSLAGTFYATIEPSVAYMTVSSEAVASNALTKINGSTALASSGVASVQATFRIAGLSAYGVVLNRPNIQIFTSSGTWTKPAGASLVLVHVIGGGAGGGSGRKGLATTVRNGGSGGGGGGICDRLMSAALVNATETVTVGASAAGGAAQATNSTDGSNGTTGNLSSFGTAATTQYTAATGGVSGQAGSAAAVSLVPGGSGCSGTGGSSTGNSAAGGVPLSAFDGITGGGGAGGPINATDTSRGGAQGGIAGGQNLTGGSGGNNTGGNGTPGAASVSSDPASGGAGGGGGGASKVGAAGTGGAGGNYGGGGGGGGASLDATGNSGTGGAGAQGVVVIYSW